MYIIRLNSIISDSLFHFCNAIHLLCDSPIPPLKSGIDKDDQRFLSDMYDYVIINEDWNNIPKKQFNKIDIDKMIDEFLRKMPINSEDDDDIKKTMKITYQTGLKLGRYVFSRKEVKETHMNETGVEFKTGPGGRIFPV